MTAGPAKARPRFLVLLIKPSHYDDDGYVVQWIRSAIPANSLACLYALAADAARRNVLGPETAIDVSAIDETNTRVRVNDIIKTFERYDGYGLVGLVGVQSNQYPRAMDLARPLRAAGIPVAIGGFHVSGVLAMLPGVQCGLQDALDIGCSLFAGEAEDGRLDGVLQDAARGALKPIYNYMNDLPSLENAITPYLPPELTARTLSHHSSFDAGRGCPFQCSFCTIINVQGRKSRRRSPDDVEHLIRQHYNEGRGRFFITDDNFARNKDWEPIFDRIIQLRERDGLKIRLTIQVDTLCHKIPNFVEKARSAGVRQVFIGLENINPANLMGAKKRQNKITEYRNMLIAWKKAGVVTYAGYIIGFPHDTKESIEADIEIIKKELPVDILSFFYLTPLPGSEDHKVMWQKQTPLDRDLNKYDLEHTVTGHPRMSSAEWVAAYEGAWTNYYTPAHIETILRRGAATGVVLARLVSMLFFYWRMRPFDKVHPLQSGLLRRRYRLDRRPGLPIEPVWLFYPKSAFDFVHKLIALTPSLAWLMLLMLRVRRDRGRRTYVDRALLISPEESETLELFTHTDDARAAVERVGTLARLTGAKAPIPANP